MKYLAVSIPPRREVERVLDKLKVVERLLNKNEAAFLREQFLSYFAEYQ